MFDSKKIKIKTTKKNLFNFIKLYLIEIRNELSTEKAKSNAQIRTLI